MISLRKVHRKLSPKSVKRFYHLDYYCFVLFALRKKSMNDRSLYEYINNNMEKFDNLAFSLISAKKFGTKYSIGSVLEECINFGFITSSRNRFRILAEGENLLEKFLLRKQREVEIIIGSKMENLYGGISQIINVLYRTNIKGGLVVFPKPSPQDLGLNSKMILEERFLKIYVAKFAEYAHDSISKYIGIEIFPSEIENVLYNGLSNFIKTAKLRKVRTLNIPREVKNIMYDFYLNRLLDNILDRVSFEIWLLRCKELRVINSSEFYPNTSSRVIYPTSKVYAKIAPNFEFFALAKGSNLKIIRFSPNWNEFKELFFETLWDVYQELTTLNNSFQVSVLDLRDIVCFKLQISEKDFEEFLGLAYSESIEEKIKWGISLEVDRTPEERAFVKSRRFPILINNIPKNIIAIKIK